MKVMTELGQMTVRLIVILLFVGAMGWKLMSYAETTAATNAELMKNSCPQELKVLQDRENKIDKDWQAKFDLAEADWKSKASDKERYYCNQCSSKSDLVEDQLDECKDTVAALSRGMSDLKTLHAKQLAQLAQSFGTQVNTPVSSPEPVLPARDDTVTAH